MSFTVKPNPPSDVNVISEKSFPTSLLINWTHPIREVYLVLIYEIRFCANGSSTWKYVSMFLSHLKTTLVKCVLGLVCKICMSGLP